ncbi:SpoIVB peptidase S55 domain-containing protein [Edaphobacter acidisoli]|nr:SpoIVB peptidase S55 domain-containing protein [Edaphobacter acidisoli]
MGKIQGWVRDESGFQPSFISSKTVPGATPQAGMTARLWRLELWLAPAHVMDTWRTSASGERMGAPEKMRGFFAALRMTRVKACGVFAALALGATGAVCVAQVSAAGAGSPAALPPAPPKVTEVFPLKDVKAGEMGVAYTVFQGVTPEPMAVEILGVLHNSLGPGRDLILAKLRGSKPEYTGVVAGMSGSPVYIDGKLVGALSYRIGEFSKEPIAGITPIESMLQVRDGEIAAEARDRGFSNAAANATTGSSLFDKPSVRSTQAAVNSSPEMRPIETPLVMSGFSQDAVARFADRFKAMGLTPVAGLGGADPNAVQPEPLVPGSSVSMVLIEGDLSMSGTCTVTYVDPKRLLACGHPITQYGPVNMPMTKATVVTTLASPLNAFKIINTTQTVGAFTEDRAAAIMGQFGVKARMIPVEVEVVAPEESRTYHFSVLDNRALTPSAVLVSVYQTLSATNESASEMSYRVTGELGIKGLPDVKLDGVMTSNGMNPAAINTALFVNQAFSKVYDNERQQPVVTGLKLKVEAVPERETAAIDSARLSTTEARAGDTIEVETMLHPYQAAARMVKLKVKLPDVLTPGPMRVVVSDGATVDKMTAMTGAKHAIGLADTVAELNRAHANDRVYVTLLDHAPQAVMDGEALPSVPISMANVLEPLKAADKVQLSGESALVAGSAATDYAVSGSEVLHLDIRQ